MSQPNEEPAEFLRRFWHAMRGWELKAAVRFRGARISDHQVDDVLQDRATEELWKDLRDIFRQYTTKSEPHRGLVYSEPPEYDPEGEKILEVRPTRNGVKIVTQQTKTGYNHKLVYTLVKGADGWRLRDNRVYIDEDGTEQGWDL